MHPRVTKRIASHGGFQSPLFRPPFADLIAELERDPKQHPKKAGELRGVRAARLTLANGNAWRVVYIVDEGTRTVDIISAGPHDVAYAEAMRRL